MTEHANPGPPERCFDDCPTNSTGDTEDCTCASVSPLGTDAALFARQRDDAQAIVLSVSRILGISHLADGLEHGRITDAVRAQMDAEARLTRERDSALAKAARLTRERDEAQAEADAVTSERDKLANDLGDLSLIHSVVTENEDNLRGAGHRIAGLFNRDPEDHQIAGVLRDVAEELIAWRADSSKVPDGWQSLVRKGWSVGTRPAIPAEALVKPDGVLYAFLRVWFDSPLNRSSAESAADAAVSAVNMYLRPAPVSGSGTTEEQG